jgi:ATP-binding cassette subfamily B protein
MSPWVEEVSKANTPVKFILAVSQPYKWWALATLLLGALVNSLSSLTPIIYKHIVDTLTALGQGKGVFGDLYIWLFAYIGIYAGGIFFWRIVSFFGSRWSIGVRQTSRYTLTSYILGHSTRYYENRFAGSVATKIQQARDGARSIVESIFFDFWPLTISLLISFVLAFTTAPILGLMFLGWLIITVPINTYLARKRMKYAVKVQAIETDLRGRTIDILGNIRAVHEYAQEPFEARMLKNYMLEHKVAELKNWQVGEYVVAINGLMQSAFMLGMLVVVANLAGAGIITFGSVVLVLSLIMTVGQNIFFVGSRIANVVEQWSQLKEGLEDILNPHEVVDVPYAPALQVVEGAVNFKNVSFTYEGSREILSDFSLYIKPGQKVGLVGKSGAGKSTLIKLLLRHYDTTAGSIRIDGQDVALRTQRSLRAQIAVVPQEPMLFHRTVRENIAYGKPEATQEEIVEAAKLARAHDFILRLSEGYDTIVGERGVKLSGGERQRIAFARAILKPSKVLVLDEATSALDSESEMAIQHALHTLMVGKTVIAVAHRLSTLREMDRILVLDEGRVVEDGTHVELLGRGGLYAELWARQSGGYNKEGELYTLTPAGQVQIFDTTLKK